MLNEYVYKFILKHYEIFIIIMTILLLVVIYLQSKNLNRCIAEVNSFRVNKSISSVFQFHP